MRILCSLNGGDWDTTDHAELDLTPERARRLLEYRPLVASCKSVDADLLGVHFDDPDGVRWGNVTGVDLSLSPDGWYLYPAVFAVDPPPSPVPEFVERVRGGLDSSLVVTEAGVSWLGEEEVQGQELSYATPVLGWDVIAAAAEGVLDLPTAPVDEGGPETPDEEDEVDDPDSTALFEEAGPAPAPAGDSVQVLDVREDF